MKALPRGVGSVEGPEAARRAAVRVLAAVNGLAAEVHARPGPRPALDLDSSLERHAGLDSVARMELLVRLEAAFDRRYREQLVAAARTPRDLLGMVLGHAGPRSTVMPAPATPSRPRIVCAASAPGGSAFAARDGATTLVEILERQAAVAPGHVSVRLVDEEGAATSLTARELLLRGRRIAAGLRRRGIGPGAPVALALPTGREFIEVLFGVWLVGAVPVPLAPPRGADTIGEHLLRQAAILRRTESTTLVADGATRRLSSLLRAHASELRHVVAPGELSANATESRGVATPADALALLQFTSGSTGAPKGVMLSHANLLANVRAIGLALDIGPDDVWASWLPLHHDMGLIGGLVNAVYHGIPLLLLSPLQFLARPERWLHAMHRYAGTITVAPNFAYELCVRRPTDEALDGLDLSGVRLMLNGAEPVSPATIARFRERYARYGLRAESMLPVYGLAENTLAVTFPPTGRLPRVDAVDRRTLQAERRAVPASAADALSFVSCGVPLDGVALRIVDERGRTLPERHVGRVRFRGTSATRGYHRDPDASAELILGGWVESGDLGYVADGELYLTGRSKDVIIRAGRNIEPHGIEEAVGRLPGVRNGCVAAFGCDDERRGTERLIVVAETRESDPASLARMREAIDEVCARIADLPPDDVAFAPPGTVPKTSSGKIRRAACRERYLGGRLARPSRARPWLQLARVALSGALQQARRRLEASARLGYTGVAWMLAWTLLPSAWIAAVLLPPLSWRLAVARLVCRVFFRVMRLPLQVEGARQVPPDGSFVLVSNHASYLDPMILLAALPADFTFVVKREFESNFFTRVLMRRLRAVFVERDDVGRSSRDLGRIRSTVERTTPIAVFPEGTFGPRPGLRPFRLGAFAVAAEAGVPLLPIALRGSRRVLRDEQWRFERGPLRVDVLPALHPRGPGFAEAVRLRNLARERILERLDEPDLCAIDPAPGAAGRVEPAEAVHGGGNPAPALEPPVGRP